MPAQSRENMFIIDNCSKRHEYPIFKALITTSLMGVATDAFCSNTLTFTTIIPTFTTISILFGVGSAAYESKLVHVC